MPLSETRVSRRLPIGAEIVPAGGVHFRVWAPAASRVDVALGEDRIALDAEAAGHFSGHAPGAREGDRYGFLLDGEGPHPDPASRFQPDGPRGVSEVVDPDRFAWSDGAWRGVAAKGQALYEMHVGTFTREGTWEAAARELPALADLGVTVLQVMPVAEFPGRFGWGYDGVDLFAPTRLYGRPDDFRRFVDRAHREGLGVILDLVCNHLGPDGSCLPRFSPHYTTDLHCNDWGASLNFDGPHSAPVREFFVANAVYWIREFHLDGFRFDATQNVCDGSPEHILAEITRRVRQAASGRSLYLVAENEPQDASLVQRCGMDGLLNDDFHHSAMVALGGHSEAYYTDYRGRPQEFVSALKRGFLYQGQYYSWQRQRRGTPAFGVPPHRFVHFLENHDQVANSGGGRRADAWSQPGCWRALTAVLLLGPQTPLLFQGQEFAASSPFYYFADHAEPLARVVREGRKGFLSQFPSLASRAMQKRIADPGDPRTFERSKLDLSEREHHAEALALHRDLLRLRRDVPAFASERVDGAVIGPEAFLIRFFGEDGDDRLLAVNLGVELRLFPAPEPLLAPPAGTDWALLWSSEDPTYGGDGIALRGWKENWILPGRAAVLLRPAPLGSPDGIWRP